MPCYVYHCQTQTVYFIQVQCINESVEGGGWVCSLVTWCLVVGGWRGGGGGGVPPYLLHRGGGGP